MAFWGIKKLRDIQKVVGENIRQKRLAAGYSQEAFALHAKLDRSYMGRIERGETNITLEVLNTIAEKLECTPDKLLLFSEE